MGKALRGYWVKHNHKGQVTDDHTDPLVLVYTGGLAHARTFLKNFPVAYV